MRKSILMGLGLALSFAGAAAAQQPGRSGDAPGRAHAEGHRGKGRGHDMSAGRAEGRDLGPRGLLFKDITLTDAQKAQLKTLRETQRPAKNEANRAEFEKQREEMRAARQRGDTAAVRAIMTRNRQAMEQRRAQQLAAIRGILTVDQRVQFDKNVAELRQREQERANRFSDRGHGRGRGKESKGRGK
jgi:periplasmic protein CpxP/Spy